MLHVWRPDDDEFSHQYLRSITRLQRDRTTTTPFARVVLNGLDRYRLAMHVIERLLGLDAAAM